MPAAVQGRLRGTVVAKTKGISWVRCGAAQCTTVQVPLDYAKPAAGTVDLTVSRRPADNPKGRIGLLFTNPGGPGGPAAYTVGTFAQVLGRDARARFDIIGVNPRGTGDDQPALCEGKPGQKVPDDPGWVFPTNAAQVTAQLAIDAFNRGLCKNSKPAILSHMSSGDSARDIDAVRAALGERRINYYGISYGSHLGATYSQLFPRRVRTMVVDGTLDSVAWTTGRGDAARTPMTARLGSQLGAQDALMSAIGECERLGPRYCAEHKTIRADWAQLRKLKTAPIKLADDFYITYDVIVALTLGGLYDPEGVPDVLTMIHMFATMAKEGSTPAKQSVTQARLAYQVVQHRDEVNRRTRLGYNPPAAAEEEEPPATPMYFASFTGVVCDDGVGPADPQAWVRSAAIADRKAPGFGSLWTWSSSICAGWPFHSTGVYRGSFTKRAAGGLLIMNSTHDPATPYSGALKMRLLRPDSRIVTVPGWGHSVQDTSGCASRVRRDYLISGALPKRDRTCAHDHALFTRLN
ncbi:MAG: alpha/beta hydrolase [Micrococcales bacterium]|nr:alpha/beta hydrolase [Micrococcales bacterium]